jgi:hypothetical protein
VLARVKYNISRTFLVFFPSSHHHVVLRVCRGVSEVNRVCHRCFWFDGVGDECYDCARHHPTFPTFLTCLCVLGPMKAVSAFTLAILVCSTNFSLPVAYSKRVTIGLQKTSWHVQRRCTPPCVFAMFCDIYRKFRILSRKKNWCDKYRKFSINIEKYRNYAGVFDARCRCFSLVTSVFAIICDNFLSLSICCELNDKYRNGMFFCDKWVSKNIAIACIEILRYFSIIFLMFAIFFDNCCDIFRYFEVCMRDFTKSIWKIWYR